MKLLIFRPNYCIEYGALYVSGSTRPDIANNVNSEIECRDRCLQETGCKYFTWKTGKKKNKCELRSNSDFEVKASRKGRYLLLKVVDF